MAQLVKNVVVAGVCGAIFFGQGKEEAFPTFSNSSFNVSSLWYFAMLYTVLSCLQIIPQLFFYKVRVRFGGASPLMHVDGHVGLKREREETDRP